MHHSLTFWKFNSYASLEMHVRWSATDEQFRQQSEDSEC